MSRKMYYLKSNDLYLSGRGYSQRLVNSFGKARLFTRLVDAKNAIRWSRRDWDLQIHQSVITED